ncbi:Carboxylesterase [Candidatus Izimaplasma bacterium HR1]|jgi:carboxylesterase|uniref:alpha/beta hydrolase n=1 Tax=Candidatus Izimoplasma sp. HR1 TaxID=1541959 RepID=UPI0004F8ADD0|nr:Carboxylesterase [Candidatus Izimaplasma bacterium HR1]
MPKNESFFFEGKQRQGVLLLHTLAGSPAQLWDLGKKLNKKGYFVSCPLYPGHDKTFNELINTQVSDWYEAVVEAYHELRKYTDGVYVVGMSVGGSFAVKLAEELDLLGICTINAPIIGFDVENDIFNYKKLGNSEESVKTYRKHRTLYFDFICNLGQIENLKKITCPHFVLQGSLDNARYKTSSQMLMFYTNSETKQRKDYSKSPHLLLLEADKKEAMKDIIAFIEDN